MIIYIVLTRWDSGEDQFVDAYQSREEAEKRAASVLGGFVQEYKMVL